MSEEQQSRTPRSKGHHYQLSRRPRSSQTFRSSCFDNSLANRSFGGCLPCHEGSQVNFAASPTWQSSIFDREKQPTSPRPVTPRLPSTQRRTIATGLASPDEDISRSAFKTGKKMLSLASLHPQEAEGGSTHREAAATGRGKKNFEQTQRSSNQIDTLMRSQFDLSGYPAAQGSEHRVSKKLVAAPLLKRECTSFSGKRITGQTLSALHTGSFPSPLSCGSVDSFDIARSTGKRRSKAAAERVSSSVFLASED